MKESQLCDNLNNVAVLFTAEGVTRWRICCLNEPPLGAPEINSMDDILKAREDIRQSFLTEKKIHEGCSEGCW